MPHRVSTPPEQGSPRYGGDRIEPVASFGNRSKLLKSWKKTATSAVMAAAAHGPENVAITRIPVPHSGSESHAFFSAHRSRLMLWPAPCAEAHSVCATKNSQPVKYKPAPATKRTLWPVASSAVLGPGLRTALADEGQARLLEQASAKGLGSLATPGRCPRSWVPS